MRSGTEHAGSGWCNCWHGETKVATVALANKTARTVWAIMTASESYREPIPQTA